MISVSFEGLKKLYRSPLTEASRCFLELRSSRLRWDFTAFAISLMLLRELMFLANF